MFSYTLDGYLLEEVSEEKGLGVIIDKELKFRSHTALVVNKANRMLGLIRIFLLTFLGSAFINLYKVLIRPILEYGNTIWGPFYTIDSKLENIRRKATKLIPTI